MKPAFYPKLAFDGISKNKKLYIPYLLTCVLSVSMYYIMRYLCYSEAIKSMPKTSTITQVMGLGSAVIMIFSTIFLFYTNAFITKTRKKEFGLYNILGMDKNGIGKILFFETGITALASVVLGIVTGIVFSKLSELAIINLVDGEINFSFSVPFKAIWQTVTLFFFVFFVIFLNGVRQVGIANPLDLVKSRNLGEKPPKANFVLGISGFLLLGLAYYTAVSIDNPIEALTWFFVAVIMVIVGSYMIFISGSVMLIKILQKKKKYYYEKNHFVSVSSMGFRMKRNGAGLASICILLTMVLVMISSTSCLFFGAEDSLHSRYPKDISVSVNFEQSENGNDENISLLKESLIKICESNGVSAKNISCYRDSSISGLLEDDGGIILDPKVSRSIEYSKLVTIHIVPLEDYKKMTGEDISLKQGEAIAFATLKRKIPEKIKLGNTNIKITEQKEKFDIDGSSTAEVVPNYYFIVSDMDYVIKDISKKIDFTGDYMLINSWIFGFDTSASTEAQQKLCGAVAEEMLRLTEKCNISAYGCECLSVERNDFYGTYGGFFFLGIMLSIMFLVVAVIIIYYKQISEGFEDAERFTIMQKIGMTRKDIRKSINSQMLTVFFLPVVFSVVHTVFAFPMIKKLLLLFGINNLSLLITTTIISVSVFTLFYLLVYRITSNIYFGIVSGKRE